MEATLMASVLPGRSSSALPEAVLTLVTKTEGIDTSAALAMPTASLRRATLGQMPAKTITATTSTAAATRGGLIRLTLAAVGSEDIVGVTKWFPPWSNFL